VGLLAGAVLAACGETDNSSTASPTAAPSAATLNVTPTITELLTGVDRIGLALFDASNRPVNGANASLEVLGIGGVDEHRPLENIGPEYGGIPVYTGTASFPQVGVYRLVVHATLPGGGSATGQVSVRVTPTGPGVPVGARVPAAQQPIIGTPGVTITQVDSGIPPDPWHTATVADGLAQKRPMVVYFGEPGYCKSRTCGPTVQILQQFAQRYGDRILIEHIETHFPAGSQTDNPGFDAFGLASDPWIYFVNAAGIVADRFEGPVTVAELSTAADGTLAGRVPAVTISATS